MTRVLELLFGDKNDFVLTSLIAERPGFSATAFPKWPMMSWTCGFIRASISAGIDNRHNAANFGRDATAVE